MTRVIVPLRASERNALRVLAKQEFRDPQAQAALIIRRELQRLGLLPPDPPLAQPAETSPREVSNEYAPA